MNRVEEAQRDMKVVAEIVENELRYESKTFAGLKIGISTHITKEAAVLADAYRTLGADVMVISSNPLTIQQDVVEWLRGQGIQCRAEAGQTGEEYWADVEKMVDWQPDILIEDGADVAVAAHQAGKATMKFIQEETTTGVIRERAMERQGVLKVPVFAVNDAATKHLFDNVHGTGQSTLDGIIRATGILIAGKTFVVAGYGHCGKGVALRARGMGANVIVTEVDPVKALQAMMDGYRVMPMTKAAHEGDVFITVTGNTDVITEEHMVRMKPGAILANAGHFNVEINVDHAKQYPKLRLLAEGRLVNLVCAKGHPADVMDLSFATQLATTLYVINTCILLDRKVYDVPEAIVSLVANAKLETMDVDIDELTDEQVAYQEKV